MAQVSEQELWIVFPLILRTLGEEDASDLITRTTEFFERSPSLVSRLVGASSRLDLVDRLREERTAAGQEMYPEQYWREIDQLTAYLAASCIPIVEGAPDPTHEVFASFVQSLPSWAQEWVGRNYMVVAMSGDPQVATRNWLDLPAEEKAQRIAAHLAATSQVYPRDVDYTPWDQHDRLHLTEEQRTAPFEFAWMHSAGDPVLQEPTTVGIRAGLAESEAVRFLLVARLRDWLNCGDDEGLIDRYWARRNLRTRSIRALHELEANISHVHAWAARALYERPDRSDYAAIAGLAEEAVRMLLADPAALQRFSNIAPESVEAYLARVDYINQRVFELNLATEDPDFDLRGKAAEEEILFAELLSDPQTRTLMTELQAVHSELHRSINAAS